MRLVDMKHSKKCCACGRFRSSRFQSWRSVRRYSFFQGITPENAESAVVCGKCARRASRSVRGFAGSCGMEYLGRASLARKPSPRSTNLGASMCLQPGFGALGDFLVLIAISFRKRGRQYLRPLRCKKPTFLMMAKTSRPAEASGEARVSILALHQLMSLSSPKMYDSDQRHTIPLDRSIIVVFNEHSSPSRAERRSTVRKMRSSC